MGELILLVEVKAKLFPAAIVSQSNGKIIGIM